MDQEVILIILLICHLILSERHVTHCHIKKVIGIICFFKTCDFNIRFRIKLLCYPSGNPIKLHSIKPAFLHLLRQHTKEISDTHCRL